MTEVVIAIAFLIALWPAISVFSFIIKRIEKMNKPRNPHNYTWIGDDITPFVSERRWKCGRCGCQYVELRILSSLSVHEDFKECPVAKNTNEQI